MVSYFRTANRSCSFFFFFLKKFIIVVLFSVNEQHFALTYCLVRLNHKKINIFYESHKNTVSNELGLMN